MADTAVLGRLDRSDLIGAAALGATIFSILYWGFAFLRMGTTGLTAQAEGARRYGAERPARDAHGPPLHQERHGAERRHGRAGRLRR